MVASLLWDAPLIAGPLPTAISVVGAVGAVYLLAGRGRRWWMRSVPISVAAGMAIAGTAAAVVAVWRPFPDLLPLRMVAWIVVAATATGLMVACRRAGRRRKVLALFALCAVLATSAVKANAFYGYRPTLADVLGLPAANEVDPTATLRAEPLFDPPGGVPLSAVWRSPPGMPRTGQVARVDIPGRISRFPARQAWLYLPPAYLASPRARLPVLVLIPGQPGGPRDWIIAGRLASVMDRFAAAHDGLAPVVVVPDATGSAFGNTLCLDSRLGAAETYLTTDVPAWVAANLQTDTRRLATGGFSFGGTCALQLAVRRPDVYPSFLDIAGQVEPTLGDHARTVRAAFGGDEAAFRRINPLDELRRSRFPDSAGVLAVGRDDTGFRRQAELVAATTRTAGMSVALDVRPGSHSWSMAAEALDRALPWLAGRAGLVTPAAAPTSF